MKLPTSVLLIAAYFVAGNGRCTRNRYYYSSPPSSQSQYTTYRYNTNEISGLGANADDVVNIASSSDKPHPSLSCLLFNDEGCQMSCGLMCDINGCQSEGFCQSNYHCECNEIYFVEDHVLTANQFKELSFQDLWNYKFFDSFSSSALQDAILRDNELYKFTLPLLQNPHKSGEDVKNALLQRYPQVLKAARNLQPRDHGIKNTLFGDNGYSLEQYIQELIHTVKSSLYDRIAHVRYMRRIINLIKNITDQDDLRYILHQLRLTGNERLYERVRRYLIKKGYYFDSEFPSGRSGRRGKCGKKRRHRKKGCGCKKNTLFISDYNDNYSYDDDINDTWSDKKDKDAEIALLKELMNTSQTDGQFPNTPPDLRPSPSGQTEYVESSPKSQVIHIEEMNQPIQQPPQVPATQTIEVIQQPPQSSMAQMEQIDLSNQPSIVYQSEVSQNPLSPSISQVNETILSPQPSTVHKDDIIQLPQAPVAQKLEIVQQPPQSSITYINHEVQSPQPSIVYSTKVNQQLPPPLTYENEVVYQPQWSKLYKENVVQQSPLITQKIETVQQPQSSSITHMDQVAQPSEQSIVYNTKVNQQLSPPLTYENEAVYQPQPSILYKNKLVQQSPPMTQKIEILQQPPSSSIAYMDQVIQSPQSPIVYETKVNQKPSQSQTSYMDEVVYAQQSPIVHTNEVVQSTDTTVTPQLSPLPEIYNEDEEISNEVNIETLYAKRPSPSIASFPTQFIVKNSAIQTHPSPYIDNAQAPVILETYDIPDTPPSVVSTIIKNQSSPTISQTLSQSTINTIQTSGPQHQLTGGELMQIPSGRTSSTTITHSSPSVPTKQLESYAHYLLSGGGNLSDSNSSPVKSSQIVQTGPKTHVETTTSNLPPPPPAITAQKTKDKIFYNVFMDENGNIIKSSQVVQNASPTVEHITPASSAQLEQSFDKMNWQNILNAAKQKATDTVIVDNIDDIHNLPTPDYNLSQYHEGIIPDTTHSHSITSINQKLVHPNTSPSLPQDNQIATDHISGAKNQQQMIITGQQQTIPDNNIPIDLNVGSTLDAHNHASGTDVHSSTTNIATTTSQPYQRIDTDNLQILTDDGLALDYEIDHINDIPIDYHSTAQSNQQGVEIESDNQDASGTISIEITHTNDVSSDRSNGDDDVIQITGNIDSQVNQPTIKSTSNTVTSQIQTTVSKSSTTKNELNKEVEIIEGNDDNVSIEIMCDDPINPEDDLMNF